MLPVAPFALERYFARHEFAARRLLSASDCESMSVAEVLELADDELRERWRGLRLGYTHSQGLPELREEAAGLYSGLGPENLLVVTPEEGIFLTLFALLEPGDEVVCPFPAYQSLPELARALGCTVRAWEPHEEEGWEFRAADLERLLNDRTRLVIWNFPHNPTGALPAREEYERMVDLVAGHGAYLLSDEMYRSLEVEPVSLLPSAADLYDRAVVLAGMSKIFGLPGLRIGWLASKDANVLGRAAELKDYTTICSSAPSELLALAALRAREAILARQRARLVRNLELAQAFFAGFDHLFGWHEPRGGTIAFVRLRQGGAEAFAHEVIETTGLFLLPSTVFGYGDAHLRFGFGREDLPQGLAELETYLERRAGLPEGA